MSLLDNAMLFVRVVQAGSLTKAAEQLYSSKSQISRRMASLEQQLDANLLIRTPRGLSLTPQGRQFYQSCLDIQHDFEQAKETLQLDHTTVTGNIAITAPMSLGSLFLGPLLAKFMTTNPGITIELDLSDHAINLTESRFDLAIRAASKLPDSNLRARKVFSYDYVIAASAEYIRKYGMPESPTDLKQHRCISCLTSADPMLQTQWAFKVNDEVLNVPIPSVAKVTHMWVQKKFALEGVGLIRVPRYWVHEALDAGSLCSLFDGQVVGESHIFVLYKNAQNIPLRFSRFIDFIAQHLPKLLTSVDAVLASPIE